MGWGPGSAGPAPPLLGGAGSPGAPAASPMRALGLLVWRRPHTAARPVHKGAVFPGDWHGPVLCGQGGERASPGPPQAGPCACAVLGLRSPEPPGLCVVVVRVPGTAGLGHRRLRQAGGNRSTSWLEGAGHTENHESGLAGQRELGLPRASPLPRGVVCTSLEGRALPPLPGSCVCPGPWAVRAASPFLLGTFRARWQSSLDQLR